MAIFNKIKEQLKAMSGANAFMNWQRMEFEKIKLLQGRALSNHVKSMGNLNSIREAEFGIFSQLGDDGIIQYLINRLNIQKKIFIEFGVQNYIESNTRFLLMNDNWSGLVIDGSQPFIDFIKNDYYFWRYDLKVTCRFLTVENINDTIAAQGITGEIGLLHIDIDGNDYWIWEAIHIVQPVIVVIEYNSCFGSERAITVPYDPGFERTKAHYSNIYYGASLSALVVLGKEKGYVLVGANSQGNDAYFIRKDHADIFKEKTVYEEFVATKCRQNKDKNGRLTYEPDYLKIKEFAGLTIYNIETKKLEALN